MLMLDLGLRGVYVEHPSAPPPGTRATVRFTLPGNDRPIEASCRVAWRHDGVGKAGARKFADLLPGCGLEFTEVDGADTRRIARHVAAHLAKAARARQFVRPWPDPDEYLAHAWEREKPAP